MEEKLRQNVTLEEEMEDMTEGKREADGSAEVEKIAGENLYDMRVVGELGKKEELSEISGKLKYWMAEKVEEDQDGVVEKKGICSEDREITQNANQGGGNSGGK